MLVIVKMLVSRRSTNNDKIIYRESNQPRQFFFLAGKEIKIVFPCLVTRKYSFITILNKEVPIQRIWKCFDHTGWQHLANSMPTNSLNVHKFLKTNSDSCFRFFKIPDLLFCQSAKAPNFIKTGPKLWSWQCQKKWRPWYH